MNKLGTILSAAIGMAGPAPFPATDVLPTGTTRRRRGIRKGRMTQFEHFLAASSRKGSTAMQLKETPRFPRTKKGNVRQTWRDTFARRSSLRAKKYLRRMAEIQL